MNRAETTWEYVKAAFEKSEFMAAHPEEKTYRLEHTLRVTNIGRRIAAQEGMDMEAMTVACLLHDISYVREFADGGEWKKRGRLSAKWAEPFIKELRFSEETEKEILLAIAVHADDQSDYEGSRAAFVRTVGDADNIDRMGAWRMQETLRQQRIEQLSLEERKHFLAQGITDFKALKKMDMATQTAKTMWQDCLDFRIHYYGRLYRQMELSGGVV